MNGGWTVLLPALIATGTMVGARPAAAQCRLCSGQASGPSEADAGRPVALSIEASLDFDRLVLTGAGGGTALLAPDGMRSVSGNLAALSGRAMVGSATVHGEPERMVRIELPERIVLYGTTGGRITIDRLRTDVPPVARLDSSGTLSFRFGGELRVAGEVDGDFRGEVPITVEYL